MDNEGKTIAQQLHGQKDDTKVPGKGRIQYDSDTMVFTFEDGSTAKLITTHEDCEPYITASLSTLSKKPIKVWKAL